MLKVKVCGMKYPDNIIGLTALKPDYMGFIFYPQSPRCCAGFLTPENISLIPPGIIKTAVFVNEGIAEIRQIVNEFNFDMVQLHGDESHHFCEELKSFGIPLIKAFRVGDKFNFSVLTKYTTVCDYFLFDTNASVAGGSGRKFNWDILADYNYETPFFLSGGIGPGDLDAIKQTTAIDNLHAVDINSKFETEPGLKDLTRVGTFIDALRLQSESKD